MKKLLFILPFCLLLVSARAQEMVVFDSGQFHIVNETTLSGTIVFVRNNANPLPVQTMMVYDEEKIYIARETPIAVRLYFHDTLPKAPQPLAKTKKRVAKNAKQPARTQHRVETKSAHTSTLSALPHAGSPAGTTLSSDCKVAIAASTTWYPSPAKSVNPLLVFNDFLSNNLAQQILKLHPYQLRTGHLPVLRTRPPPVLMVFGTRCWVLGTRYLVPNTQ